MHGGDVQQSLQLQRHVRLVVQLVSELHFLVREVLVKLCVLFLRNVAFLTSPNCFHDVGRLAVYIYRVVQKVTVSLNCLVYFSILSATRLSLRIAGS